MNDRLISSCDGKQRFETRRLALKIQTRKTKTQRPREVYRCHVCEGYHLGTPKSKEARTNDRRPYDDERPDLEGRN